jgi:hypothetical protein
MSMFPFDPFNFGIGPNERVDELSQRLDRPTVEYGLEIQYGETGFTIRRTPDNRLYVRLVSRTPGTSPPFFYGWIQVRLNTVDNSSWEFVENGMWGDYDGSGLGPAYHMQGSGTVPYGMTDGEIVEITLERYAWVFDWSPATIDDAFPPGGTINWTDLIINIFTLGTAGSDGLTVNVHANVFFNIAHYQEIVVGGLGTWVFDTNVIFNNVTTYSSTSITTFDGQLKLCGKVKLCYDDVTHNADADLDLTQVGVTDKPFYNIIGATTHRKIYGIIAPEDLRLIILYNTTDYTYTLLFDSPSSGAAERRLYLPNLDDYHLRPKDAVMVWYSPVDSRWHVIGDTGRVMGSDTKIGNYTIEPSDLGYLIDCTDTLTITLPIGTQARVGFYVYVRNSATAGHTVTIAPNAANTINGAGANKLLTRPYDLVRLVWTGGDWAMSPDGYTGTETVVTNVTCNAGTLSVTTKSWLISLGLVKSVT